MSAYNVYLGDDHTLNMPGTSGLSPEEINEIISNAREKADIEKAAISLSKMTDAQFEEYLDSISEKILAMKKKYFQDGYDAGMQALATQLILLNEESEGEEFINKEDIKRCFNNDEDAVYSGDFIHRIINTIYTIKYHRQPSEKDKNYIESICSPVEDTVPMSDMVAPQPITSTKVYDVCGKCLHDSECATLGVKPFTVSCRFQPSDSIRTVVNMEMEGNKSEYLRNTRS